MKKLYIVAAFVGMYGTSDGMFKTDTEQGSVNFFRNVRPFEWLKAKLDTPISTSKPRFFSSWSKPDDVNSLLCHIKYRGYSIADIDQKSIVKSIHEMPTKSKAISTLFYAKHILHDSEYHDLVDICGKELEAKVNAISADRSFSSTFLKLLEKVKEDEKFTASLSIVLFESEFSDEAQVWRSGYNSEIVESAILQMCTLEESSKEEFLQEAENRLSKFGLHVSIFIK
jgi:hypothetical protein